MKGTKSTRGASTTQPKNARNMAHHHEPTHLKPPFMRDTTTMHHGLERCKHISRHVLQYEEADATLERRRGSPHFKASGLATWHRFTQPKVVTKAEARSQSGSKDACRGTAWTHQLQSEVVKTIKKMRRHRGVHPKEGPPGGHRQGGGCFPSPQPHTICTNREKA